MSRNPLSRRSFLAAGVGATAVAATSLLPPSLQRALATPVSSGGLDSIEHVVLVMQENRSFDHYYGALRGVRGFGDPNALRLRGGHSVFEQPGLPVLCSPSLSAIRLRRNAWTPRNVTGLDHSWAGGHAALADGWHDGWIAAKNRHDDGLLRPARHSLSLRTGGRVHDLRRYHCSVPTSTSPNRNYWVSGYTGYEPLSPNPTESVLPSDPPGPGGRAVTNAAYNPWHAGYGWTTVPERLQSAGISWKTYQEWDNFGDNNLEYFTAFKKVAAGLLGRPSLLPYELQTLAGSISPCRRCRRRSRTQRYWPSRMPQTNCRLLIANSTIARCTDPGPAHWPPSSGKTSSPVDCRKSAISFRPRWIRRHPFGFVTGSERNTALSSTRRHRVRSGSVGEDGRDRQLRRERRVLRPCTATSTAALGRSRRVGNQPLGLGPRVPMTIISPWTVGGFVCSQVFDHTSVTQFLEKRFGITQPEIDPWRRTVSGDLTSAFDFANPRSRPTLARPQPTPPLEPRWTRDPAHRTENASAGERH